MKRFLAAVFAFILLLSLTGCHGDAPKKDSTNEPYRADGELTQAEVRGNYDILFKADGEEPFGYSVDFITLDNQLASVYYLVAYPQNHIVEYNNHLQQN